MRFRWILSKLVVDVVVEPSPRTWLSAKQPLPLQTHTKSLMDILKLSGACANASFMALIRGHGDTGETSAARTSENS